MNLKTRPFTRKFPCSVCGGHRDLRNRQEGRCYGFLSSDGKAAHCTRGELAGGLIEEENGTYAHWLIGSCKCGHPHVTAYEPKAARGSGHKVPTRWQALNAHTGAYVADHCRIDFADGKRVWWQQPNGTKGLPDGIGTADLALYGVDQLGNADRVVVVEGEKSRDALNARGVLAVGTVTGDKGIPCDDALRPLLGLPVVLWPDADADPREGLAHMQRVGDRLLALGHGDVGMITWADAPAKGDAADFDGDDDALAALIASAVPHDQLPAVELRAVLDSVRAMLARFVVLSAFQLTAITLWVAHTHAFAAAQATPYLAITSAEKRSGKTRLLEILDLLVARPWLTGKTTTAALVRKIDKQAPSLLLDESDTAFNGDKDYAESLRGILNTGHRRGGVASLCIGQGANLDVKDFQTFCPKAIAGIGKLPSTIADRSIAITMTRRKAGEAVERFRRRDVEADVKAIKDTLAAWALTACDELARVVPDVPDALDDRATDGWEPLIAIADLAGGGWPDRARAAAIKLSGSDSREDDSLGVRLLGDIRAAFAEAGADRLSSTRLAGALCGIEESPWGAFGKGNHPVDARRLASLLKPHKVTPKQIRIGEETLKGYMLSAFADVFARYLPSGRNNETSDSYSGEFESGNDPKQTHFDAATVSVGTDAVSSTSDSDTADRFGVSFKTPVSGALTCYECGSSEITVQGSSGRCYCAEHERRCPPDIGHEDALCEGCGRIDWTRRASGGLACHTCQP